MTEETTVQSILNWFYKNFEAIEENTPRDDGEWVFIWGEPELTRDIVEDHYGQCAASDLAVRVIDHDRPGIEQWVPVPECGDDYPNQLTMDFNGPQ